MGSSHSVVAPEEMSQQEVSAFVDRENRSHQIVIWSKSYCMYCIQTKNLIKSMPGVDFVVHDLNKMKSGDAIQRELKTISGQRTVPNVFVQGQHLGGNSDTKRAHRSGELAMLVGVK